jgi:acetylglutamate kinase
MPEGTDLGFVGEICEADARWLEAIWSGGGVPVLASLAPGEDGEYYNVNADAMASACAAACRAEALVFLTDVSGVRHAAGEVMARLRLGELPGLQAAGVVSGGMLPKLKACADALHGGVARVRIAPASAAGEISAWILAADACGTEVTA